MENPSKMKVSVIVPIYNCQNYLRQNIESLIHQTYKNLEIILVDDGSTDKSGLICDEFKNSDYNIKIIHQENQGISEARNTGIEQIDGDYFTFVDGDDWLGKNYVLNCVRQIKENNVDVLATPYKKEYVNTSTEIQIFDKEIITNDNNETKEVFLKRLIGPSGKVLKRPSEIESLNSVWGKFYKTSKFGELRFLNINKIGSEDLWFNINATSMASKYQYFPKEFYHYNKLNQGSYTHNSDLKIFNAFKNLYGEIELFLQKGKYSEEYFDCLNNRVILNLQTMVWNSGGNVSLLKELLNDELYEKAFKKFNFSKLSVSYKVFFKLCEHKSAFILSVIFHLVRFVKNRNEA